MGVFKLDMSSGKIPHIEPWRVRLDSYTIYVKIANVLNDELYQDIVIMTKLVFDQELLKKNHYDYDQEFDQVALFAAAKTWRNTGRTDAVLERRT